ncbi:Uncharacterized protein TPAR_02145 [Tolypocladium paradoxum]|uniref:Uncharacterized protein n=1 Tax=Tolypocladium paradoxum TaxID=94208 RepID=A0A2S4L5G5_9HYPO|nr:Uncharacterized protein TPAR_02145 [Tolypocladium paradoxum]
MFFNLLTRRGAATGRRNLAVPFQCTNPWRDLPQDKPTLATIRDVLFISKTLAAGLVPTSLPGDDYALWSSMLRTESRARDDVSNIGARGPIPEEPFRIPARARALGKHWEQLQRAEGSPSCWEAAFDTTSVPALLPADSPSESRPFERNAQQLAEAEEQYAIYRSDRDRALSYFKRHPPPPLGYVSITRKGHEEADVDDPDASLEDKEERRRIKERWSELFRAAEETRERQREFQRELEKRLKAGGTGVPG